MLKQETIPYFSPDEMKGKMAGELKRINKIYTGDTVSNLSLGILNRYLAQDKKDSLNILDTGTSSGSFCGMLFDEGYKNIYAIDIDDYRSDEVKMKNVIKEFKNGDLSYEKFPWPDNFFDAITGWCIVPHLENPHNFIREAFRTIRPGGFLFISLPNVTALFSRKRFFRSGEIERYTDVNDHISIFTPALVKKTILKYFDLKEITYFTNVEKIANGRLGFFKKLALTKNWKYRKTFEKIYGHNIVYILQKP